MRALKKVAFKYWIMRAYEAVDHGDGRAALEMALRASDFASAPEHRKELGYLFYGLDWVNHSLSQFQLGMYADPPTSTAPHRCYDVQERVYQELLESGRLEAREDLLDTGDPAGCRHLDADLPERVWGRIGTLHDNLRRQPGPVSLEAANGGRQAAEHGHDLARRVEQSLQDDGSSRTETAGESTVVDLRRYRRRREDREMAAIRDGRLAMGRPDSRPAHRGRS